MDIEDTTSLDVKYVANEENGQQCSHHVYDMKHTSCPPPPEQGSEITWIGELLKVLGGTAPPYLDPLTT